MGLNLSLYVFMRFYVSFEVVIGPHAFACVLNGPYRSLCVLMGPCESLLFNMRPYGSL